MKSHLRAGSCFLLTLLAVGCSQEQGPPSPPGDVTEGAAQWPQPPAAHREAGADATENPWITGWGTQEPDPESMTESEGRTASTGGFSNGPEVPEETSPDDPAPEPPPLLQRYLLEYWEGSGPEKLLIIGGDPGTSPVDCAVEIYSNGGSSPWRRLEIPAEMPETGALGLCNDATLDSRCLAPISGSVFNGNDALVVRCGSEVMDSFGRLGEDPGKAWGDDLLGLSTEGQRLARCEGAIDVDPADAFFVARQWRLWSEDGVSCEGITNANGGAGGAPVD